MNEKQNEAKVLKIKFKTAVIGIIVTVLILILGCGQIYASTQGYGNIFFLIKYLVIGETTEVTGKENILSDKDITISYKPINLTENIRMQIRNIQIKDNTAKLILVLMEDSIEKDSNLVPFRYKVYNSSNKLLCEQKSSRDIKHQTNEYTEELILNDFKKEDTTIILEIYKANDEILNQININLNTREIIVEGQEEAIKKISEVELKKYLGYISRYALNPGENNEMRVLLAQDILEYIKENTTNSTKLDETNKMLETLGYEKVPENFSGRIFEVHKKNGVNYIEQKQGLIDAYGDVNPNTILEIKDISYCAGLYTVKFTYTFIHPDESFNKDYSKLTPEEATLYFKLNEDDKYSKFKVVKYVGQNKNSEKNDNTTDNEKVSFTTEEVEKAFQEYLNLVGRCSGSPESLLGYLKFNTNQHTNASKEGYRKTNIKYNTFKEKILNYVTESCYEKEFGHWFYEENGYLCYFDGGATGERYKVISVSEYDDPLKKVNLQYIAHTIYAQEEDNRRIYYGFSIENYNGICVIDDVEEEYSENVSINALNNNITENSNIDIKDYIGMWYENESLEGYSDICIDLDENNNILLEIGIYRFRGSDNLDVTLDNNIINFKDKDNSGFFYGNLTLEKNKIILVYSADGSVYNEKVEFNYKKERKSTEILSGYDISGNWKPSSAKENGKEISLEQIYGSGIKYEGFLTLNKDNTYTRFIGVYSDEIENDLKGTYQVKGNKIIFTTNNGKVEKAEYISGHIGYDYGNGIIVSFYQEI